MEGGREGRKEGERKEGERGRNRKEFNFFYDEGGKNRCRNEREMVKERERGRME